MAFVIEYYKEGVKKGSTSWDDTLEKTKQVAMDGLIRHDADFARIVDDNSGAEVASVIRSDNSNRT